jgi:chromosome partitioning protein
MRILSVANQKGGCGKTTVAVNLASSLVRSETRVLLVDNDPQGHASMAVGVAAEDFSLTTRDLYLTSDMHVEDVRLEVRSGLDLVPADVDLATVEQELRGPRRVRCLAERLAVSEMPYDVVVIDNPPNVGLLTFNALMASGEVIVPVDAGRFTLDAVERFRETLALLADDRGHHLKMHLLASGVDVRTRFAREVLESLDAEFPGDRLETLIHQTVRLREAAAVGQPIDVYDPASRGAYDFDELAQEVASYPVELFRAEMAARPRPSRPEAEPSGLAFAVRFPEAREVCVTGDFTEWSVQGHPLRRHEDGTWHAHVPVDPGCYEYKFIVDGVWKIDPDNPERTRNSYGQLNSVAVVRAPDDTSEESAV